MSEKDNNKTKERTILDKSIESCLVCASPTSKLHLQVHACYACAAFYRRSVNNTHERYKCQSNSEKCNLTIKVIGKSFCRLCRFKKCEEIGMKINNNRNNSKEPSKELLSELPQPEIETEQKQLLINIPKTMEEINSLFAKTLKMDEENFNYTQKFNELLLNFLDKTKAKQTPLVLNKNDDIRVKFVNQHFIDSANMLSCYLPFSELQLNEKIAIHEGMWQQFLMLDRCYHTVNNFGNDVDDFRMPVDNFQFWHYSFKDKIDVNEDRWKYPTILKPVSNKLKDLMSEYKKVNPTFEEFAYICQIILWSLHDVPDISLETQNLADRITEKLSENMHDYYNNELRIENYAVRQSKMFKLINLTESLVREKKHLLIAQEIFDFGSQKISWCRFQVKLHEYLKEKNEIAIQKKEKQHREEGVRATHEKPHTTHEPSHQYSGQAHNLSNLE